jgi:hypothetical protein
MNKGLYYTIQWFSLFLVWNVTYLFVFSSIELYGYVLETTHMDGLLLRSLQIIV